MYLFSFTYIYNVLRVYRKQLLYTTKLRVRSAYIIPSANLTRGTTLSMLLFVQL